MGNSQATEKLVQECLEILKAFGIPLANRTERRNERTAKAFLAVAGIKPGDSWVNAKSNDDDHRLTSRETLHWMNEYFDESLADSSYDDIRRQDLILPVTAGIVLKSAGKEDASQNDGTRAYALNPDFCKQIKLFGTNGWITSLEAFMQGKDTLVGLLNKKRELVRLPVMIEGKSFNFSAGKHNQLQKAILENFLTYFGYEAKVLYVGDTEDKYLYLDKEGLERLKFFEISHGKLPDILAYSESKNWLFLIEAVYSANPIDELRKLTLEELTKECTADIVFVTAFLEKAVFRKFAKDIAWETEVWIAENPEHLIHFNGGKFLGPHKTTSSP